MTEVNPTGTGLIYSTYLGGSSHTGIVSLALDAAGEAEVEGLTQASDFPTTPGAFEPVWPCSYYCNVAMTVSRLNSQGTGLLYSSYLGGSTSDTFPGGIVVDGSGTPT